MWTLTDRGRGHRLACKRAGLGILAVLLASGSPKTVQAREPYEVLYEAPDASADGYTVLTEDLGGYEVSEGDSLWSISEALLGDGDAYVHLARCNADVVEDPDLIYPGMRLRLERNVYVTERTGENGIRTPEYRVGSPDGWGFGVLSTRTAFSNYAFSGPGAEEVVCLIQDKKEAAVESLSDWERCARDIERYAKRNYGGQVSDLAFSRYVSESGNAVFLFSYVYALDGSAYGFQGSLDVHVCEGICLTEHIQAEFTGYGIEEDLQDVVLYMAASFEELPGAGQGSFSVNGYNVQLTPSDPWAVPGIHDPFVWIEQYFDSLKEVTEKSAKERILGR